MQLSATQPPAILSLVAEPIRWQLVSALAASDRRVGELTAVVGKPQNLVSYHLGELRKAEVVTARRSSADRRDVYYSVDLLRCRDLLGAAGQAIHPGLGLAPTPPSPPAAGRATRVLFLCTGNSARSQMAEALLERLSGKAISARSAGSHPKPLHPNAVRVMAERGIDIAANKSKHLDRFGRVRFDRVVTLCDKVREVCPELSGAPVTSHWSIADPAAEGDTDDATYPAFQRTADALETRIGLLMVELGTRPPSEGKLHDNR